jgi:hypothetical protein
MTDDTTPEVPAVPDQLDMSMKANADVNWVNPDSLTRDQLIRINGINTVLGWVNRLPFKDFAFEELIDLSDRAADYIRNGKDQA